MANKKRVLFVSRVSLFPPEHGGAKNLKSILRSLARYGYDCRVLVKLQPTGSSGERFSGQNPQALPDEEGGVFYFPVQGELPKRVRREIEDFKLRGITGNHHFLHYREENWLWVDGEPQGIRESLLQ
jgi:hypothetical protein